MSMWPEVTWQVSRRARMASGSLDPQGEDPADLPSRAVPARHGSSSSPATDQGGLPSRNPVAAPPQPPVPTLSPPHPTPVHTPLGVVLSLVLVLGGVT